MFDNYPPAKMQAEVGTLADWLDRTRPVRISRPDPAVSPCRPITSANKRMIIPRGQRPGALRGKNTFVLDTKRGPVLFQRLTRGKRKGLVALYGLEKSVKIRKQSTFYEPIGKVVKHQLNKNIREGIAKAFATMK